MVTWAPAINKLLINKLNRSSLFIGTEIGGGDPYAKMKVWVRSEGAWFQMLKPRMDTVWKPPGAVRRQPLHEALLPETAYALEEPSPIERRGRPCRPLHHFSVIHEADGAATPILELLQKLAEGGDGGEAGSAIPVKAHLCGRVGTGPPIGGSVESVDGVPTICPSIF